MAHSFVLAARRIQIKNRRHFRLASLAMNALENIAKRMEFRTCKRTF